METLIMYIFRLGGWLPKPYGQVILLVIGLIGLPGGIVAIINLFPHIEEKNIPNDVVQACDNAAGDPDDFQRTGIVPVEKIVDPAWVAKICGLAVEKAASADAPRLRNEHGRALDQAGEKGAAIEEYHRAADSGYAPSAARYGNILYKRGDYYDAIKYYESSQTGSALGQFLLGLEYITGRDGVLGQDIERGEKLIKLAAAHNNIDAINYVKSNN